VASLNASVNCCSCARRRYYNVMALFPSVCVMECCWVGNAAISQCGGAFRCICGRRRNNKPAASVGRVTTLLADSWPTKRRLPSAPPQLIYGLLTWLHCRRRNGLRFRIMRQCGRLHCSLPPAHVVIGTSGSGIKSSKYMINKFELVWSRQHPKRLAESPIHPVLLLLILFAKTK